MNRFYFVNNFRTTLAEPADVWANSLAVVDAGLLGDIPPGKFLALTLTSAADKNNREIVYCTGRDGNLLTGVDRGQEGTQRGGNNWETWPVGTLVEARITGGMLDSFPSGFDNAAGELGWGATNIQAMRGDPSNYASGDSSVVVGNARAAGWGSVAIGDNAQAGDNGSPSVAIGLGAKAEGAVSVAVGNGAHAGANSPTTAIGNYARAIGEVSTAIGNTAEAAEGATGGVALGDGSQAFSPYEIAILSSSGEIDGREAEGGIFISTNKTRPFEAARHVGGLEFVDQSIFHRASPWGPLDCKIATEMTLYSAPIQIGDQGWQPETAYVRGQAIAPGNGFSYVARISYGDGTEHTATSGTVEPSWGTTPGGSTADGSISWYCHPLDATWLLPDYARFIPLRALIIATHASRGLSPVEAEVSVGIDGDMDKWLAPDSLSAGRLSGPGGTQILELTNSEWAQEFGFELTAPGEDMDLTAIFVLQGLVVESPIP